MSARSSSLRLERNLISYFVSEREAGVDDPLRRLALQPHHHAGERAWDRAYSAWRGVVCERRVSGEEGAKGGEEKVDADIADERRGCRDG